MKGFAMSDILRLAWRMLVGIFLLMVLEMPCMASTPQQLHTLEQIANKKTITLGYQDDAFPFSWQNGNAPQATPLIFATVSLARSKQNFSSKT